MKSLHSILEGDFPKFFYSPEVVGSGKNRAYAQARRGQPSCTGHRGGQSARFTHQLPHTSFCGSRIHAVIQKYCEREHGILGSPFTTRRTHSSPLPTHWGRWGAFPRIPREFREAQGDGLCFLPPAWLKGWWGLSAPSLPQWFSLLSCLLQMVPSMECNPSSHLIPQGNAYVRPRLIVRGWWSSTEQEWTWILMLGITI